MSTRAVEAPSISYPSAPRLFKIAASLTFALGVLLHVARLVLGSGRVSVPLSRSSPE
ncbi:MAG TPA: hypothetical protein VGK70_09795 [Thermoanaerobaculia bacterium]|jgi:hypothetical protein